MCHRDGGSDIVFAVFGYLRKSIKKEANLDLDKIERRIEDILKHEIEFETMQ